MLNSSMMSSCTILRRVGREDSICGMTSLWMMMIDCNEFHFRGCLWDLRDCTYGAQDGVLAMVSALRVSSRGFYTILSKRQFHRC
jgi:hypothetical protein